MRKFVCAAVVTVFAFSLAAADDIRGRITKIDGDKITVTSKKKGEEPKTYTFTLTDLTKVNKGKFDPDTKKFVAGDPIAGGTKALTKMLDKAEKGIGALISVEGEAKDGAKVTEIRIMKGKGGKRKKQAD